MKPWSLCANAASETDTLSTAALTARSRKTLLVFYLIIFSLGVASFSAAAIPPESEQIRQYRFRVLKKLPHDRGHFTQGLSFYNGYLFESTGQYGKSKIIKYQFPAMQVAAQQTLAPRYFGEGLDIIDGKVYQLTWRGHSGFVYSAEDLQRQRGFSYQGEGWGLCSDGTHLIMSDGSTELTIYRPEDFHIIRHIAVSENGRPVKRLNELEWVDGKIFANIWQQNRIVMINPANGRVEGSIDLSGLLPVADRDRYTDVLNGIAFNRKDKSLWVTGKRWPWIYQIELVEITR